MKKLDLNIRDIAQKYRNLIFTFIFLLLFCYIYKISIQAADSDMCSMVLEASDILNGNILLNNWYLTGINFLTTDMLYFLFSTMLFGISAKSVILSLSLYAFFCFVFGFFLIKDNPKELSVSDLILFLFLCGCSFPFIRNLHVHCGCFIYSYLTLFLAQKYLTSSKKRYLVYVFILASLSLFGDLLTVAITIAPILFYSLINLFKNNDIKKYTYLILSIVLASATGMLLLKIFIGVSTSAYNYIENYFIDLQEYTISDRIILLLKQISILFGMDFYNRRLFDFSGIISFGNIIIVLVSFSLIYKNIKNCILQKNVDFINACLSFSAFFMLTALLLTTYNIDISTVRYIAFLPISCTVIILRSYKCFKNISFHKYLIIIITLLIMFSSNIYLAHTYIKEAGYYTKTELLVEVLKKYNLKNGINNDFWFSNSVTVFTNNQIKVRTIRFEYDVNKYILIPYRWFSKQDWYNEPVEFVIFNKELNEELKNGYLIEKTLEKISRDVVEFNEFKIYILKKTYKNHSELNSENFGMIGI